MKYLSSTKKTKFVTQEEYKREVESKDTGGANEKEPKKKKRGGKEGETASISNSRSFVVGHDDDMTSRQGIDDGNMNKAKSNQPNHRSNTLRGRRQLAQDRQQLMQKLQINLHPNEKSLVSPGPPSEQPHLHQAYVPSYPHFSNTLILPPDGGQNVSTPTGGATLEKPPGQEADQEKIHENRFPLWH